MTFRNMFTLSNSKITKICQNYAFWGFCERNRSELIFIFCTNLKLKRIKNEKGNMSKRQKPDRRLKRCTRPSKGLQHSKKKKSCARTRASADLKTIMFTSPPKKWTQILKQNAQNQWLQTWNWRKILRSLNPLLYMQPMRNKQTQTNRNVGILC